MPDQDTPQQSPVATPPRGLVLALGSGLRSEPSPGHAFVTIEMAIDDVRRVPLYSIVEIVGVSP